MAIITVLVFIVEQTSSPGNSHKFLLNSFDNVIHDTGHCERHLACYIYSTSRGSLSLRGCGTVFIIGIIIYAVNC